MGIETAILGAGAMGLFGGLAGGAMQADAASSAAQTQANAANQANQLQYQMFREQQALMQPWVQSGRQNLDRLNYAMYGQLPPAGASTTPTVGNQFTPQGGGSSVLQALFNQVHPPSSTSPSVGSAPGLTADQMGVRAGGLNPDWRFSTQDWQNSPEYAVYQGARESAIRRSQDALLAQNAASGMYGSGTMANQLATNLGDIYAQYDPQSLAAARQAAEAARTQEYNQLAGLSSPTGAQQVAQYAGIYGQNAGQNMLNAGNALAQGQMGSANAWGNALNSGFGQVANAYGQYRGQQNFNQMMNPPNVYGYGPQGFVPSTYGQMQDVLNFMG